MAADPNEPIIAYHVELDRKVLMPRGNLEIFGGWVDSGEPIPEDPHELAELLAIPAEQGQPTDSPAVTGDPTVAIGDETKE